MVEKIGPYRVEGEIGRGGMGVVYRATDPRLDRAVALKALPDDLAADPDRLARFETEARTLAALNHPNVAGIHGLEEAEGRRYLVLELVEGETLAELLARGPLPLDQTLDFAIQIASGLAAAHEAGIVHRDLKPANVKVTPEDKIKVLDFGLAKANTGAFDSGGSAPDSPTMSAMAPHSPTLPGMIMGTAGYMSPEQARGKEVDRRSDVFAFGCVLYEMLTGAGPFGGETVTDSIGAVLHREPDWSALPAGLPSRLRLLLERCLAKDRDRRLHDIADARIEIEDLKAGGGDPEPDAIARKRPRGAIVFAFALGATLAAGAVWLAVRPDAAPRPVRRFELSGMGMPIDSFQGIALSPDGSKLIFRARDGEGNEQLQMRSFDTFDLESLPGSESGWLPFFSPDGTRVGFYTAGELRSVGLRGGLARTIARVSEGFSGGVWMADDTIVFAGQSGKVFRVSAAGGEVEAIELDGVAEDSVVTSPALLPGGKALLCSVRVGGRFDVAVFDLDERKLRIVIEDGFTPVWARGHVLYQQGVNGPLVALPFDPERLAASGSPFPVLDDLGARVSFQVRMFSVADDGTLAFIPKVLRPDQASLVWIDAGGQETSIAEIDRVADTPRISGDGTRIAFRTPAPNCDIWVHDLERGTTTRVTREEDNHGIAWWPGDRRLAFTRQGKGTTWGVFSGPSDGAGKVEVHSEPSIERGWVSSVSPDGKHALVSGRAQGTNADIGVVSLEDGTVSYVLDSRFDEEGAVFSPNGRHIAYSSNESGRSEVYVKPFPALDARTQVSGEGGNQPVWSRDGSKLYFRRGRSLFAAEVQTSSIFSAMRPVKLLEADFATSPVGMASYDVAPDGKRFAVFRSSVGEGQVEVKVILNWFDELERLAAAGS